VSEESAEPGAQREPGEGDEEDEPEQETPEASPRGAAAGELPPCVVVMWYLPSLSRRIEATWSAWMTRSSSRPATVWRAASAVTSSG
jgi:hypothetical protein